MDILKGDLAGSSRQKVEMINHGMIGVSETQWENSKDRTKCQFKSLEEAYSIICL